MQLKKGSKNFLIFLILISFTSTALASPKVNQFKEGDAIPYNGWCFNDVAMAKIIADKELENARCELRLNKQADTLNAKFKFELNVLQIRLDTLQDEYTSMNQIKSAEIAQLESAALDRPNDYWYLFTAGGFAIGATVILGIWFVVGK